MSKLWIYLESSRLLEEFASDDWGLPFPADSLSISHIGWYWLRVICLGVVSVEPADGILDCSRNFSVWIAFSFLNSWLMLISSDNVEA